MGKKEYSYQKAPYLGRVGRVAEVEQLIGFRLIVVGKERAEVN